VSGRRTVSARLARLAYRALLFVTPRGLRRAYRLEMLETFDAVLEGESIKGPSATWRALLREALDLSAARAVWRDAGRIGQWRQAGRALLRRPGFAVTSVATLALGVGATTALFSMVNTVLLRPMPYPGGDRLVMVLEQNPPPKSGVSLVAPVRLQDWNRLSRTFEGIAGLYTENITDTSRTTPERLAGRRVTPGFFEVHGTPPIAGRTFTSDEERSGGPGAAILSEGLWTRRYGRDPGAVGQSLQVGDRVYEIVGVMPEQFANGTIDVWLPAQLSSQLANARDARFVSGIGRLKPGVTVEQAQDDLMAVSAGLAGQYPATDAGWSVQVQDLKEWRVGEYRRTLWLVFGAVALLWAISVANIAGLVLVQMHRRAHELALRTALGASRGRVIAGVVREGAIVAVAGGVAGVGLATWLVRGMRGIFTTLPRMNELAIDARVLMVAAAASLGAAIVFSLLPALAVTRTTVVSAINRTGRGATYGRHRLQKVLVVAQVALSVLLAGSAALLVRSYVNLTRVDTGFDATDVVTFHVGARWDEDRTAVGQLQARLLEALEQLPHVQSAGFSNFLPATGATLRYHVRVDGIAGKTGDGAIPVGFRSISPGYLRTLGVPLIAGESCPALGTNLDGAAYVLVNREFVNITGAGNSILGRNLHLVQYPAPPASIVGIVGDVIEDGSGAPMAPYAYVCYPAGSWPDPEYVVRTTSAAALAADLRQIVRSIDPARAVFGERPLQAVLDRSLDAPRLDAGMLGLFAMAAVGLAALGLYGLFMLLVSEGTREIAVRLALGANPADMIRMVARGAARLLAGGLVAGLAMTVAASQLLQSQLFGVRPLDVPTLAMAVVALSVVAVGAIAIPALRASRVRPIEAMRAD